MKTYKVGTGPDPALRLLKRGELQPYTAAEIAILLRCHVKVVYSLIATGKLRTVRVGREHRITRAELERYLAGK